jgi:cell division septal protein FtsQ
VIYARVPQDSVISPLLWNLVYDRLIKKFDNLNNVKTVASADDLAILIAMNRDDNIEIRTNDYMNKVAKWYANAGMQIAKEKTEIILLTDMRIPKEIKVNIANKQMTTATCVKYLGRRISGNTETTPT